MKKPILKNIFFWILITSFIISLLIIFVTPYFFESFEELTFRLLISFCIFFGALICILLFVLFKKENTAEKESEKEYKKRLKEKIKDLRTKFKTSLKVIKASSLYKYKRKAKYELPWYLVIGDKDEGKTTLLEASGLDFPLNVDYKDKEFIEEVNTVNFQWYYSENSVFIDVPGNYIELKENREDPKIWKEFLNIFTRKRWKRPINGVLLSLSVEKIMNKSEKELELYAKSLRDRFDELSKAFMSRIPIYLIITKSDKIVGFNEYFSTLSEDEKSEILGITFDNNEENIDSKVIKPKIEELIKRLNSSVLDRMHFEWEVEYRQKIFLFCENLSDLFEKANLFTNICFSETRYRKPLRLRGIYLTTVPGEFNPHSMITQNNLDIARTSSPGLFIKKLLNDIIFPEADIIKMDDVYNKKVRKKQIFAYTISLIIVTFFSFFIIKDFLNHNNLLINLQRNYAQYKTEKSKLKDFDTFVEVNKTINSIYTIKKYEKDNSNDNYWNLIFFDMEDRKNYLTESYYNDLKNLLLPKVASLIEKNIKYDLKSYSKTWNNTKAYVMLNNIKERDSEYLKLYMEKNWNKLYPNNPKIQRELNLHWNNLLENNFSAYELKNDTLSLGRKRLTNLSSEVLTYQGLKTKFEEMNLKDFKFSQVLVNNVSSFRGNSILIPGFYTKIGFNKMLKDGKALTKESLLNNWIMGKRTDLTSLEIDNHFKKILNFYFQDYKKYWNKALVNLNLPTYSSIGSLNAQLSLLSSSDSPIILILRALKENTELYTPSEVLAKKAASKSTTLGKNVIGKHQNSIDNSSVKNLRLFFKPYNSLLDNQLQSSTVLNNAINKINKTYETMNSIAGSINPSQDSFNIVHSRVLGKSEPIVVSLNSLPIYVRKWFKVVLQSNWKYLLKNSKSYISSKYKEEVFVYYDERIKGKYPLNKNARVDDIKLDDFSEFFKTGGIMDKFYKNYIQAFVKINPNFNSYYLKNVDGNVLNIDKRYMDAVLKSLKIRKSFFKNDGSLGFSFAIKPQSLSGNLATMELTYDSEIIYYEHGPIQSKKITWPAQSFNNAIKFNLYDLSNNMVSQKYLDDDWALFKLIDNFNIKDTSNNSVNINFKNKDYIGAYDLRGKIVNMFKRYSPISSFELKGNP